MRVEPRIVQLISKQLRGIINAQEKAELEAWINASAEHKAFMEKYIHSALVEKSRENLLQMDTRRIDEKMQRELRGGDQRISRTRIRWIQVAHAAAILAGVIWVCFFIHGKSSQDVTRLPMLPQSAELATVVKWASVTWSDGEKIDVDAIPVRKWVDKHGYRLTKTDSATLSYRPLPADSTDQQSKQDTTLHYLVFATRYGMTLNLDLPEGLKVELSTGSSLSYPLQRPGLIAKETLLGLQGEAFFEAVKNKYQPLKIRTSKAMVTVLGTSFNVRDYIKEDSFSTTLVDGSVKVSDEKNDYQIRPGETASLTGKDGDMRIGKEVDTGKVFAWRLPYFDFTNLNIKQVMKQVEQWYGMDRTVFKGTVDTLSPGVLGGGHAAKDLSLDKFLEQIRQDNIIFWPDNTKIVVSNMSRNQ